jgi:DoxX-like family
MQTARKLAQEVTPSATAPRSGKGMVWTGRVLSALPVALLIFSGILKLVKPAGVVQGFEHFGLPIALAVKLGILEIACAVVYAIPRTAVLGAILVTGYMGGATLTHVRLGEPWVVEVLVGVLAWGGLYLRDARIRALIPVRRSGA